MRMYLKMAGGGDMKQMISTLLEQAKEYEESGGPLDRIFQDSHTPCERSHPFNTLRAAELQRWIEAGQYERILNASTRAAAPTREPADRQGYRQARDHLI